jgi:hypothetical protein
MKPGVTPEMEKRLKSEYERGRKEALTMTHEERVRVLKFAIPVLAILGVVWYFGFI